ncbi:Predicted lactoylglutathione lyase [Parasphingorhabdus marina DSM 22363]|uniref:Predicted lactoylglutathione lyase n=1 Tax=Parasphingorhabdus marina DSM 22363 TaxID=1123272 RepID=A0A1N6HAZ1_9SPHN|nr:VOC family protein [Parasphingorhabdus marina]SIO16952.1 Predicted lactoylglutathione lyase [Parasphingorhabdus marina DSM 22363]
MIGYVTLGTNDLEKARTYYDGLLGELGAKRLMEMEENGFTLYGTDMASPSIALTEPWNGEQAQPGNGNMIALQMQERSQVDSLYKKGLELGGSDEGAPGVRGDEGPMAFYAAYFRDPEGNKLCAFRLGPA